MRGASRISAAISAVSSSSDLITTSGGGSPSSKTVLRSKCERTKFGAIVTTSEANSGWSANVKIHSEPTSPVPEAPGVCQPLTPSRVLNAAYAYSGVAEILISCSISGMCISLVGLIRCEFREIVITLARRVHYSTNSLPCSACVGRPAMPATVHVDDPTAGALGVGELTEILERRSWMFRTFRVKAAGNQQRSLGILSGNRHAPCGTR